MITPQQSSKLISVKVVLFQNYCIYLKINQEHLELFITPQVPTPKTSNPGHKESAQAIIAAIIRQSLLTPNVIFTTHIPVLTHMREAARAFEAGNEYSVE